MADGSCAARTPGEGAAVSVEYEAGWRPGLRGRVGGEGISPSGGGGKLSGSPLPTITEHFQRIYILLQAWTGPEGSRRFRFLDFKTVGT